MMTSIKGAAIAGVLMLTAGSAWAGNYNTGAGMQGSTSSGTQSALGQSSPGAGVTADTQQRIRQSLEQSGFKDIRIVPESFVVRAQAPDGSRIVMLLSPDQVTGVVMSSGSSGMQGSGSQQSAGHANLQSGYGDDTPTATQQQAQQELARYGYSNLQDLRQMQGWSASATKNGENVRVATFPGR